MQSTTSEETNELLFFVLYEAGIISITVATVLLVIAGIIATYYILKLLKGSIIPKLPRNRKKKIEKNERTYKILNYITYPLVAIIIFSASAIDFTRPLEFLDANTKSIREFLALIVYEGENSVITIATVLFIIASLVAAHFILKILRKSTTSKLEKNDKKKVSGAFRFFRYIAYLFIIIGILDASGIDFTGIAEFFRNMGRNTSEFLSQPTYKTGKISITIGTIILIVIGFIIAHYILKLLRRIITSHLSEDNKNKFVSIFKFVNYIVYLVVVIIILSSSGVNLTVLLTASAALFVGLGFALQFLFQDVISGILIILDQSLHVGDIVEVEGKITRVLDIKLRTTRALTQNNKVIVIPNHKFLTESIYNYTQNSKVTRESVSVGVAYGSDVELVTKLLIESAHEAKGVLRNPRPVVSFQDFGDSALLFGIYFYISEPYIEHMIKSDVRFNIDKKFRENKVKIPFPQRDVHLHQKK